MSTRRTPNLDHQNAMRLAATEYERFQAQLRTLSPDDWTRPTDCPGWDVRAMATHILGMADMAASPFETRRQMKEAKKRGGLFIDALTGLQVEEREDLDPSHIVHQFEKAGPKAAKGRRRIPGILRRRQTVPPAETDGIEAWSLGYLTDIILTRDPWMHRMDIAAAVGREPELTAEHDGVLVNDVVREWAARHGQPCSVVLTGPAGGSWTFGSGGPTIELDAVDFCRTIAGRRAGQGLLETPVPF
jgi:uncharacterized protein (TIGR03083 family)